MDCEQIQQEILGWEDFDAELAARPEVAAHIAGCGKCEGLIGKLKRLEMAARGMKLPEGYATVPPAFLRRVALEEKQGGGARWHGVVRRAIAAVIVVAVGLSAVLLFLSNGQQARADVVLGQMVQWNLDIANTKDAGERAKIYQAHVAEMQAGRRTLLPEDQRVADKLLDTAQWMTTESDPLAEGERFVEIAKEIKGRADASKDPAASAGLQRVYQQVVQEGIGGRVNQVNPVDLTPEKKGELEMIQKDAERMTPGAKQRVAPVGPSGMLPRGVMPGYSSGGGVVYMNSGEVMRGGSGVYVGPVASGNVTSGGVANWTAASNFGGGTTGVVTHGSGAGCGSRSSDAGTTGASSSATAKAADHGGPTDGETARGGDILCDPKTADDAGMELPNAGHVLRGKPMTVIVTGNAATGSTPFVGKLQAKDFDGVWVVLKNGDGLSAKSEGDGQEQMSLGKTVTMTYAMSDADDLLEGEKITAAVTNVTGENMGEKTRHVRGTDFEGGDQAACGKVDDDGPPATFDKAACGEGVACLDKLNDSKKLEGDDGGSLALGSGIDFGGMKMMPVISFATTATPEPASGLVLVLGGVVLLRRRARI